MTAKAEVLGALEKLPDTASYEEIIERVESLAGIREAQEEIRRGQGLPLENVLREIPSWVAKPVKPEVVESLKNLNDDATLEEIGERIRVLATIREGLDSLDRGEGVPIEEVEKMIASWITK
jgi:predicted transcriptional regulator